MTAFLYNFLSIPKIKVEEDPLLAIIFSLSTSKGFPERYPRDPAALPAVNVLMKVIFYGVVQTKAILHGSYSPR